MRPSISVLTPTSSQKNKVYNIKLLKEALGDDVCSELHTQAVIQPQGFLASEKKSAFQTLVNSDPVMKSCASAFRADG